MRKLTRLCSLVMALWAAALPGVIPGGVDASVAHAQSGAQWVPTAEEQWLFELRTSRYRIGDGVRGYALGDKSCVIFTDVVQQLDLPIRINEQLRRATGWAFDEQRTLTIDREAGRVTLASSSRALRPDEILDTPEGWCVDAPSIGEWLGVTMRADTANSVLSLSSDSPLPFERAAQRRERAANARPDAPFSLADLPQARRPYAMWQTPAVDVVASVNYIRDSSAGTSRLQRRYELFAAGEMLGASFDARLASDDRGIPQSLRMRLYRSDPSGQLFGPLQATHVAVGDINGMTSPIGSQPVPGRGAMVTNRPLDLPDGFDRITFRGDLPSGWDAELYRNGQLIGFAEQGADGRYQFTDVRLQFGANQFEIVLYGPQGQVRREVRNIPVGIDAIPAGKTYYWAGVLQEDHDLITLFDRNMPRPFRRGWRYMFGIEHGIDRRTTVGGWLTNMMIENRRYSMVEASLRRAIGPALVEITGSGQNGGGTAARIAMLATLGNSGSIQFESVRAFGGYRSDRIAQGVTGLSVISLDHVLRFGSTALPIHVEANWRERADGSNRAQVGTRISGNWRNISLTGQIAWTKNYAAGFGAEPASVNAALLVNARFGRLRLRGEARMAVAGPSDNDEVALTAEWNQSERSDWRVELGYQAAVGRARVGVGYTRRFDRLALGAVVEGASDGSIAASLNLSFAFGPDPRGGGMRFARERLAAQGQALAEVFYDNNGDGHRQADEPLAEGVTITAGNAVAETPTGADGRAIVDALVPFRPILIGIDESSLPDPLIRPALPGVVVTPRPGVATRVELPLTQAGEVDGSLVREGGSGIEGVDLELVDAQNIVRARVRSDYDGYFLFESVPYGSYTLRIATLSAQVLAVDARLVALTIDADHPRVNLGGLRLHARATLARAPPADPAASAHSDDAVASGAADNADSNVRDSR